MLRFARRGLVVLAAGCVAVGGVALTGIDPSVATAPLLPSIRAAGVLPDTATSSNESAAVLALTMEDAGPTPPPPPTFLDEPPRRYTKDEVRIIATVAGWPDELLDDVAEVAWCESRNDPLAVNGSFRGLMQLYSLWFDYGGIDPALWADPVVNMRAALVAYQYDMDHGYQPWTQWQCRPGGRYVPVSAFAPPLPSPTPEVVAAIASGDAIATPVPSATPTPSPTPAPWDQPPSWPPEKTDPGVTPVPSPTPEATPDATPALGAIEPLAPITPTPTPTP